MGFTLLDVQNVVQSGHQLVGYPLAFLVIPLALATYGGVKGHRQIGWAFVGLMCFLYLTGVFMTLTRHDWWTWEFFRNLSFNFLGFSFVLYGYRAMYLFRHPNNPRPTRLDYFLAWMLTLTVAGVFCLAIFKNTPMRVYAIVGIILVVKEWKELRAGFSPRSVLYQRHFRYILAACFYVLTVASIVHLGAELPRNIKWLWPTILGVCLLFLMSSGRPFFARIRRRLTRFSVVTLITVTLLFGAYAMYELAIGVVKIGTHPM